MSSFSSGLIQLSQSTGAPAARVRICLVIPPSPFLLDERVFASLGILKVAAELEPFHDVSVLDLSGVENYLDALDVCPPADVFGITATLVAFGVATVVAVFVCFVAFFIVVTFRFPFLPASCGARSG